MSEIVTFVLVRLNNSTARRFSFNCQRIVIFGTVHFLHYDLSRFDSNHLGAI